MDWSPMNWPTSGSAICMTCKDWSHIWLNEGFASYFDPLFAEHDRGVG